MPLLLFALDFKRQSFGCPSAARVNNTFHVSAFRLSLHEMIPPLWRWSASRSLFVKDFSSVILETVSCEKTGIPHHFFINKYSWSIVKSCKVSIENELQGTCFQTIFSCSVYYNDWRQTILQLHSCFRETRLFVSSALKGTVFWIRQYLSSLFPTPQHEVHSEQ